MHVRVTYQDGVILEFILPEDIAMIDAAVLFAEHGMVAKVEFV